MSLNEKLTEALKTGLKSRKKNYYLKNSSVSEDSSVSYSQSYVYDLKKRIEVLENEKMELEEKIQSFLNKDINVFQKGSYNDDIRMVYEDLLCMGLSTRNVEKVIRVVLEKLAGVTVEKLPKPTFAKYMLLEARGLAQIHVASELVGESSFLNSTFLDENNNNTNTFTSNNNNNSTSTSTALNNHTSFENSNHTLHSDGTSKKGYSYVTYDINKSDGKTLVTGLREVGGGDASTQLNTFIEILSDKGEFVGDDENNFVGKTITSIKNTMSDRCATQKKFNTLFCEFRKSVFPNVIENWSNLNLEQQKSLSTVIDFFRGLHFLVGLADQAEACLKVYEKLLIGVDNKVGSLAHGGYSNGESGTTRLIRTVSKSVQERGCEKSGRMVSFATQMEEQYGLVDIPLYPFSGNRFNILFLNGAGVFYLYDKLLSFFSNLEKENKLLTAVFWDLQVLPYRVGCRALGLIHKSVTAPLWRKMELEKNVLDMTPHYQKMLNLFEKWANDSSDFLTGLDSLFPELLHKDDLFYSLIKPQSDIDEMTKQCLEMIFSSFIFVSKRMLHDHLANGKLNNPSEELVQQAVSVPTTNADAERDFGMLDRLMKLKPKALDIVYEGIIMYNRNKTKEWRNSLSKEQLAVVTKKARCSKSLQKKNTILSANPQYTNKEWHATKVTLRKKKNAQKNSLMKKRGLFTKLRSWVGCGMVTKLMKS